MKGEVISFLCLSNCFLKTYDEANKTTNQAPFINMSQLKRGCVRVLESQVASFYRKKHFGTQTPVIN